MVALPHWPIPYGKQPASTSLERMCQLLERLDNPHRKLPPTIHVAGTNGKGSTIAFLRAIFEAAGYTVHRYTSPHLLRYNERIMLRGKEIDDAALFQYMEETRLAAGEMQVTFFEGTTAAALLAFAATPADVLLLETGMGGRLDPTNVVEQPIMSIITPIAYDHVEFLGTTLTSIAREKAGIIKPGVPCVISWQYEEALNALRTRCEEVGAPYFACRKHWNFAATADGFIFDDGEASIDLPRPSLAGKHQLMNAATAVAAIECMPHFEFRYKDIIAGLTNAVWPARLERIERGVIADMLPLGWELWLDGAHNPAGAEMLALMASEEWADRPLFLINGRTKGRDLQGFLQPFVGKVQGVVAVPVLCEPKTEDPNTIAEVAVALGLPVIVCGSIHEAVKYCLTQCSGPARILTTGSLYLAADVRLST